jgi:purine-nucleoside phosphorylase
VSAGVTGLPGPGDDLAARGAEVVRGRTQLKPAVAVVLGSGLGAALSRDLQEDAAVDFSDLPGLPSAAVPGHAGRLVVGRLAGVPVAAFFGRVHFYEGHGMDVPALLPRIAQALGVETIVLTAAVGALVPELRPGTVVVLSDHLNQMGTAPMRGWRYPGGMPAFVPMQEVYDEALATLARERAGALGIGSATGIYAAMSGPAYETPAEVAFLRAAGATVVGMSMVPEAVPARALGLRVLGLCSVTNALGEDVVHEEVVRVSDETAVSVGRLLKDLLPRL